MNPEQFNKLLEQCDPAIDFGRDDSILCDGQSRWSDFSRRRVVVRRRVSICMAASTLIVLVGGLAMWGRQDLWTTDPHLVAASSADTDAVGPQSLAVAASADASPSLDDGRNVTSQSNREEKHTHAQARKSTHALPKTPRRQKRTINLASRASEQLAEFASFIDRAGNPASDDWGRACDYLANQSNATQRAAIELVTRLVDPERRGKAFDLVCQAAGDSNRDVLNHWLSFPSVRSMAWDHLSDGATLAQSVQLIELAASQPERHQLCRSIAMSSEPESVAVLLDLTRDPDWRSAVRLSAGQLNGNHIQSLIMLMRERNMTRRTAAAFVLASVPGEQVDQVVASMILGGRFRQPAYLVLLSRDTPQARAFLAAAASSPELTPALVSARLHFANMEKTLHQWIAESNGASNERSDTSLRIMPDTFGNDRCVSLLDARHEIG